MDKREEKFFELNIAEMEFEDLLNKNEPDTNGLAKLLARI